MARTVLFAVLALGLCLSPARAADKVTLEGLLRQMTDLSLLAEFPDPPYVSKQFSSYERLSESPKDHDRWFANHDRGFMLYDGVVKEQTPYFRAGPKQAKPADGHFAAGTRVGIARNRKPVGEYVWAYATAADGGPTGGKIPQGYIARSAITMDPQGHVLADMDGPGCVVRIWSANPQDAGNLRVFLDGAKEPVLNAPMTALLSGKWKTTLDGKEVTPFPDPIAHERSRGFNLYFPFAYAKHCKITIDKPDIYYHVNYRTYPKGTEVETFRPDDLVRHRGAVEAVAQALAKLPGPTAAELRDKSSASQTLILKPGITGVVRDFPRGKGDAGQALVYLECKVQAEKVPEALRGVLLKMWFDDAKEPQVCCPLGDFFGTGPGANAYTSLPLTVAAAPNREGNSVQEEDETVTRFEHVVTLTSRWRIPYAKAARYEFQNLGKKTVIVEPALYVEPYRWNDRSLHFHARWRAETMKTRPFRDWTYCDLKGRGVFVGDMLSIMNPVPAWWGEGDEKIYVDGETFPSWFGTGTEDYYGYAWSNPQPFQHAYHNQTRCDGKGTAGTFGHSSVNRFHVLDAIPFTKSFRFDMEVWHWTPNIEVAYAATSYWYARPGATDDFKDPDAKTLQNIPSPPPPFKIAGALEGEGLKILGKSGDFEAGPQNMTEFADGKWSGNSHLWVRPPKEGAWLDLALPVPADGKYRVVVYLTRARDYGVLQFHLNGERLGKPIDCFNADRVVSTGAIDLGAVELKKGTATLRGEVVGTNAKSVGLRYMWGLDCVVLKPAK
jgi:hypothetical protein